MDQQPKEDLARRVRELEAQNQSLLVEFELFRSEAQRLEAMVNDKSCIINAHESLHGRVFTLFSRLPPELRIRIWKMTLSPRVVTLCNGGAKVAGEAFQVDKEWFAKSDIRALSIRRVCKESRDVFLREYVLLGTTETQNHHTYFNAQLDTLFFIIMPPGSLLSLAHYLKQIAPNETDRFGIRNLILGVCLDPETTKPAVDHLLSDPKSLHAFDEFAALEEVTFTIVSDVIMPTDRNIITHPESNAMCMEWEQTMQRAGNLKAMSGYTKWADLKVTVAMIRLTRSKSWLFTDEREGRMLGPANKLKV